MAKRPISAVGNRRPVSEYAKMAAAMGGNPRYKVSERARELGGRLSVMLVTVCLCERYVILCRIFCVRGME